mmetsp:Transcript_32200/g.44681  ORF Transcript_32200/g.44681 Transcript_32200/m.44681 type:complete len:253 (+) Transcript_32200:267-1025(+)
MYTRIFTLQCLPARLLQMKTDASQPYMVKRATSNYLSDNSLKKLNKKSKKSLCTHIRSNNIFRSLPKYSLLLMLKANSLGNEDFETKESDKTYNESSLVVLPVSLRGMLSSELTPLQVRQWPPQSLALLGDGVWEMCIRQAFFVPRTHPQKYNQLVKQAVRAETQADCLDLLTKKDFFTEEESAVLKWGRNSVSKKPPRLSSQRGGAVTYSKATALECLVGYLYLLDSSRLQELIIYLEELLPANYPTMNDL